MISKLEQIETKAKKRKAIITKEAKATGRNLAMGMVIMRKVVTISSPHTHTRSRKEKAR